MLRFITAVTVFVGPCAAAFADFQYSVAPLGYRSDAMDTIPTLINNSQTVVGFADVEIPSVQTPFF